MTLVAGRRRAGLLHVAAGLLALAVSVAMRVQVAGVAGAQSATAGLVFAVMLMVTVLAYGRPRVRLDVGQVAWGLGATAVLCAPAFVAHVGTSSVVLAAHALPRWALVVTAVAVAEELLLRGALFDAVTAWRGETAAVLVTTVAFAALHVPIYGAHVWAIDLAAGLVLGTTRIAAGSVTAPALAHILADLATWWLR